MDKHSIVCELKRIRSELGRTPTRDDLRQLNTIPEKSIRKEFGTLGLALSASGIGLDRHTRGESDKFVYKNSNVDPNFLKRFVQLDLKNLFKKAGNPEVLRVGVMGDVHVEHMDPYAVNCFLEFFTWYQPHVFIIMGDFLNAGGLSHWGPDSTKPKRIVPEVLRGRKLLHTIKSALSKTTTFIYLEGNHEDWINQFMRGQENPQLFDGIEELGLDINLNKLLELDKHGIDLYPLNKIVRIGDAAFTHGLYTGDNHAKKHLSQIKANIFYGHCHDDKAFNDTSMNGPIEAQSMGCLCDLNPSFLKGRPNNWIHAAPFFEFFPNGTYTRYIPKIIEGRMSLNGKIFKA